MRENGVVNCVQRHAEVQQETRRPSHLRRQPKTNHLSPPPLHQICVTKPLENAGSLTHSVIQVIHHRRTSTFLASTKNYRFFDCSMAYEKHFPFVCSLISPVRYASWHISIRKKALSQVWRHQHGNEASPETHANPKSEKSRGDSEKKGTDGTRNQNKWIIREVALLMISRSSNKNNITIN